MLKRRNLRVVVAFFFFKFFPTVYIYPLPHPPSPTKTSFSRLVLPLRGFHSLYPTIVELLAAPFDNCEKLKWIVMYDKDEVAKEKLLHVQIRRDQAKVLTKCSIQRF